MGLRFEIDSDNGAVLLGNSFQAVHVIGLFKVQGPTCADPFEDGSQSLNH